MLLSAHGQVPISCQINFTAWRLVPHPRRPPSVSFSYIRTVLSPFLAFTSAPSSLRSSLLPFLPSSIFRLLLACRDDGSLFLSNLRQSSVGCVEPPARCHWPCLSLLPSFSFLCAPFRFPPYRFYRHPPFSCLAHVVVADIFFDVWRRSAIGRIAPLA